MTNLEVRLQGTPSDLTEGEKNAVVRMAELIRSERGQTEVTNVNNE